MQCGRAGGLDSNTSASRQVKAPQVKENVYQRQQQWHKTVAAVTYQV